MPGFHSRGVVYLGARKYFDRCVPGGSEAVGAALDRDLAAFWGQIFLAGSMYEALPIVEVSRVASELAGLSHRELVRRTAEWLAERDIRGVYKVLFGVLSPESVAVRLARVALRYFDFGEASATMVGERVCRAEQRSLPQPMSAWFSDCVTGFVPKALTLAGARDPEVKHLGAVKDGELRRVQTVTLRYEFVWR
ncbi:MAG TPA: hypothetical protein VH062_15545 [Polyangiaceae bacterium]|jgi:hypothetical protein|nr:hypothetical protein [Polyangiaceae bacterium]